MESSEAKPVLNDVTLAVRLKWRDEFDGDLSQWHQDTFETGHHKTGNTYLNKETGEIDLSRPWSEVQGRWAARYDKHRNKCQFIRDGNLVLKGCAVNEPNPFRDNFTDSSGTVHPYGYYHLFTAWLSTLGYTWIEGVDGAKGKYIVDPDKTSLTFGPGTVIEYRVNLENQIMRGHRQNLWFMPVTGDPYDDDPSEVEINAPEVENPSRVEGSDFGNRALLKVVGGKAGDTPNGSPDLRDFGIDIRKGWHTFTTVWGHDGALKLHCDGVLCNQDDRKITMLAYMILAREMNSGVKEADSEEWQTRTTGPKMPADPGLTGQSVILDLDLIDKDEVLVDYVRVWDILPDGSIPKPKIDNADIDLGTSEPELTLDEKIKLLGDLYEVAEKIIIDQRSIIKKNDIEISTIASARNDIEKLYTAKVDELATYREKTNTTISRLKAGESQLLSQIDELKQRQVKMVAGPPVTEESVERLDSLLERAERLIGGKSL